MRPPLRWLFLAYTLVSPPKMARQRSSPWSWRQPMCKGHCYQGRGQCPHPERCFAPDATDHALFWGPLITALLGLLAWLTN